MSLYQDFDYQEETKTNHFNRGKKKEKNTFIYESFNDRLKKIKVRLSNNLQNDISFVNVDEAKGSNFKFSENESNFLTMLNREKILNATPEFIDFLNELKPYSTSYLILVNNSTKLINIFSSALERELNRENLTDRNSETILNQRNYPFILSILEVMIGFIKDIREDASEVFFTSILPNLIKLLNSSNNTEVIDKIFSVFVNLFKFLSKGIEKNFRKFFLIFSELLFNKNKSIRKFSCESICFLVKNLDKKELSNCLRVIFEVFDSPQLIFSGFDNDDNVDIINNINNVDMIVDSEYKNFDQILLEKSNNLNDTYKTSKEFLNDIFSNFKNKNTTNDTNNIYLFIVDCISDLLFQILIGVNKNLSIKADLILEKIYSCFTNDEDENSNNKNNQYLIFMKDITVIDTCMKLFNYVNDNQKKSVICLFIFYLLLINNKNNKILSYPKLNIEPLSYLLNLTNFDDLKTNLYSLIFIRELTIKFYNRLEKKTVQFLIELFKKCNLNLLDNHKILKVINIEILTLFLKFNPEEFISIYKTKNQNQIELISHLFKNGENLNTFLQNLKQLQNYNEFLQLTLFEKRKNNFNKNLFSNNDEYDTIYNNDLLNLIFDQLLNNIKCNSANEILNIITSYEYLILDKVNVLMNIEEESNKFNFLQLKGENKELIINYLNESKDNFESDLKKFDLDVYMNLYCHIVLLNLVKTDTNLVNFNLFENLVNLLEKEFVSINPNECFTIGLKNSNYFDILFSEFNNENVYYMSKRQSILNLIDYFLQTITSYDNNLIKRIITILIKNTSKSYGITYKILNRIISNMNRESFIEMTKEISDNEINLDTKFLTETLKIMLCNNNQYKLEYLKFIKFLYYQEYETNSLAMSLTNEIFSIIENTLEIVYDFKNDKKYTFNIEVLMSKIENIILNDEIHLYIYLITFYFLKGSYWIRYTKSVWSVLTKALERFYEILNTMSKSHQNVKFFYNIKREINNQLEDTLNFIQNTGTNSDFISKYGGNSQVITNYYLTFKNENSNENLNKNLVNNLISLTFLYKQDTMAYINLLYEGYLQGLQGYSTILNNNEELMQIFTNFVVDHLNFSIGKNNFNIENKNSNDDYFLCLFNNYIIDKEHKSPVLSKKFIEALLLLLSKCDIYNTENKILLENLKSILYTHIVVSKSTTVQKYAIAILINIENRLKPYKILLDLIIDNTNVIERLHNLDNLLTDHNTPMKPEEREILIPLIIRLYYSKYFYLQNDNKKMKTKNKINLVSFFIQLNKKEFEEYLKILFEPLNNSLSNYEVAKENLIFENISGVNFYFKNNFCYNFYDLRAYKKVLEILTLNLKQITSLFNNSVTFISILLKNILIFIKNLNSFIKNFENEEDKFYEDFYQTLKLANVDKTKYINYFNKEGLSQYLNFFKKNVKEIKKQTFVLLRNIIIKFYEKKELVSYLTKEICYEYKNKDENVMNEFYTLSKPNSMLEFFLSFSRNPQLHFIYIENEKLFKNILDILKNENLEKTMLVVMLEFMERILEPYHKIKVQIAREEFENEKRNEVEEEKEMIVENEDLNENIEQEDVDMDQNSDLDENSQNKSIDKSAEENSVIIEELQLPDEDDDKTNAYLNLPTLSKELLLQNEQLLILKNFSLINDNLLSLVKNKKIKYSIRDNNTKKSLEILVYLWNMFDNSILTNKSSIEDLLNFLIVLITKDKKIFKYENSETLSDVLKICHMLFRIYPDLKHPFYRDFLSLIYKIQEAEVNNRLILTILLQEYETYYNDKIFKDILILITNLNLMKKKGTKRNLDDFANLDVDNTIDQLNIINLEYLKENNFKFYHLEPLIYQLLILCKCEDYSLQTISIGKLKVIFDSIEDINKILPDEIINVEENVYQNENLEKFNNDVEKFTFQSVLDVMFDLLQVERKGNFSMSLSRTILEILSHINFLTDQNNENDKEKENLHYNNIICRDLYLFKLNNSDYTFFEAILNMKYEMRIDAINTLNDNLSLNKISYSSLTKIVIPILKTFLTPFSYLKKGINIKEFNYNARKIEVELINLINACITCIPQICKILNLGDLREFLLFFHNQIEKTNKKGNPTFAGNNNNYNAEINLDLVTMLYRTMTKIIETITKLYVNDRFDFDTEFNKQMRMLMEENNKETMKKVESDMNVNSNENNTNNNKKHNPLILDNKALFKKAFEKLTSDYMHSKHKSTQNEEEITSLIKLLNSHIFRTIKYIVVDNRKKEKAKSYYLRNFAIKPYIELLKLNDPYQIKFELITLTYELINNLKNRDLSVREKSREGIKILFESLGVFVSSMILDELKSQLHSGYQRFIMGYTCNFIINLMNKIENTNDTRIVLTFSSHLIMPILLDEMFGEVAEEREIEQLINKYKEAKQSKTFQSFFLIASKIELKSLIVNIIYPFWEYLIKRDNEVEVYNKVNESINHIIKGLKNNKDLHFDDILSYSNALIKMGIDINLKNSREINLNKKVLLKGEEIEVKKKFKNYKQQRNETFTLQLGATNGKNYSMEIADKFINNKNEVVLSNIFTHLGLEIFWISIKKKLFEFNSITEKNDKENNIANVNFNQDLENNISLVLQNVILCLEISNSNILSKSLKILIKLFDCKMFVIKKNLRRIVKHLFRNLNMINSQDINISQTILSAIGDVLTKYKYTSISDNKLKVLINFIKLNANNYQIKPYVYSCFLNIIKRKIIHPSIYDMIEFIQENYLTAFEENTITICQNILIEFLSNYPLDESRFVSHVNFFVINLESPTRKCIINSLKMIYKMFEELYKNESKEKMSGIVDFIILKLLTILTNIDDSEIKILIVKNLENIFNIVDVKKEESYLNKIIEWLDVKNKTDKSIVKLSLNLLSVLCNTFKDNIEKKINILRDLIMIRIKDELDSFENELEMKLENEEYNREGKVDKELDRLFRNEDEENLDENKNDIENDINNDKNDYNNNNNSHNLTILSLKFENWDVLYLLLTIVEKLMKNYYILKNLMKNSEFCNLIIRSFKHPHLFIKTISMRILNNIINSQEYNNSYILNLFTTNSIDSLFTNFKFLLLNQDINDKLSLLTIQNSSILINLVKIENPILFNISLEYICRLYIESKSYLTNRETSKIIFNRIFDLFDNIIIGLDEIRLKEYLDPVISLCFRVGANRLVTEELKSRSEKILNNLKEKIDGDVVALKYKQIKDNVNLLKRKRKIDLLQNSLNDQKEYLQKKYKKK